MSVENFFKKHLLNPELQNSDEKVKEEDGENKEKRSTEELFNDEFCISIEELEKIEHFSNLSEGQKRLVYENLKQITLGRIEEGAVDKLREDTQKASLAEKIWKNVSKTYQIAKNKKESADDIMRGGIKIHGEVLKQLCKGMANFGVEVELNKGEIEIQYASNFLKDSPEIKNFNKIATEFSKMPYEWSLDTATSKEREKYQEVKAKYEAEKIKILNLIKRETNEVDACLYLNNIDKKLQLNQFLNSNPDVEKCFQEIKNQKLWNVALSSIVTERGIYAAAGYLTRAATVSMVGLFAAPLAAAGMGGFLARKRAKETLREQDKLARKGHKDIKKTAKNVVSVKKEITKRREVSTEERDKVGIFEDESGEYRGLSSKIEYLISKIEKEEDEKKQSKLLESLETRINYTQDKIDRGLIDFGTADDRLRNQYELMMSLSKAKVFVEYFIQEKNVVDSEEKNLDKLSLSKRLERFLSLQEKNISKERKKYLRDQMIHGVIISATFATAGYAIRHFAGEWFNWDKSNVNESKVTTAENKGVDGNGSGPDSSKWNEDWEKKLVSSKTEQKGYDMDFPSDSDKELKNVAKEHQTIDKLQPKTILPHQIPNEPSNVGAGIAQRSTQAGETIKSAVESTQQQSTGQEVISDVVTTEEASNFTIKSSIKAEKGDSVWDMARKYLESNDAYKKIIQNADERTAEALQTYNIDKVKDLIVANPEKYGLPKGVDMDKLSIKQLDSIKWQEAFNDCYLKGGLTQNLTQEQIDSIVQNNKTLKEFFEGNHNSPITNDKGGKSLKDNLETQKVFSSPPVTTDLEMTPANTNEVMARGQAQEEINKRVSKIYKNIVGNQIEEWDVMSAKSARDILDGDFGEPIGHGLDQAEINNREELQEYLQEAKKMLGHEPIGGQTVVDYVQEYEMAKAKIDYGIIDENLKQEIEGKTELLREFGEKYLVKNYYLVNGIKNEDTQIKILQLFEGKNLLNQELLEKNVRALAEGNLGEQFNEIRANLEDGKVILHFGVKDNALDVDMYITKTGKIFVDGHGLNNKEFNLTDSGIKEAFKFLKTDAI